jgi:hypothetical protein
MTRANGTAALEIEPSLRGAPFGRGELRTFPEDVWVLAQEDPDPARWAQEFIDWWDVNLLA